LSKIVNSLKLAATFSKAEMKKELNTYIKQLGDQLSVLKLKAKIDRKSLKAELNKTLSNATFKEIDAVNVDESKAKLKIRKVIADAQAFVSKLPIAVNFSLRKQKLENDLASYLDKHSKIGESSALLGESEKVKSLIDAIDDKESLQEASDGFRLFKSEVSAAGYATASTSDKHPDNSADKQGLISDLGGWHHANALSNLLSRWDLYEKMLPRFLKHKVKNHFYRRRTCPAVSYGGILTRKSILPLPAV